MNADQITAASAAATFAFGAAIGAQLDSVNSTALTTAVACVAYTVGYVAAREANEIRSKEIGSDRRRSKSKMPEAKNETKRTGADSAVKERRAKSDAEGKGEDDKAVGKISSYTCEKFRQYAMFGSIGLVSFVAALVAYSNCLPGAWIYDDWEAIVFNNDVTSVARMDGGLFQRCVDAFFSADLWQHDFWGQPLTSIRSHKSWRPLTTISYRLQAALILAKDHLTFSPEDATYIRGANVVLHACCSGIVALWLRRTLRSPAIVAIFAGLLFAVHPVHTEVVNGGVGRAEILSALFFMLCLQTHAECHRAREESFREDATGARRKKLRAKSRAMQLSSLICGFFAMLSKETGITSLAASAAQDVCLTRSTWLHCRLRRESVARDSSATGKRSDGGDSFESPSFLFATVRSAITAFRGLGPKPDEDVVVLVAMWRRVAAMIFATAASLTLRFAVMGWATPGSVVAFSQFDNVLAHTAEWEFRWMTGWYLAGRHMSLLFWPLQPLCHDWSLSSVPLVEDASDARNGLSVIFLAGLVVFAAFVFARILLLRAELSSPRCVERGGDVEMFDLTVCMGGTILLLPFIPASNLLFWVGFVIAERVMYLPSIGACILIAVVGYRMSSPSGAGETTKRAKNTIAVYTRRFVVWGGLACLVFGCAVHTRKRNEAWKSPELLYKEDMAVNPANAKIPYGLARVYINRGRDEEAEEALLKSLSVEPKFGDAMLWLGRTYFKLSAYASSEDPRSSDLVEMGLHMLRLACETSPDNFDAHVILGDYLARSDALGQIELHESTRAALRAAEIRPYSPRPYLVLARVCLRRRNFAGAEAFLESIVQRYVRGDVIASNQSDDTDLGLLFHRDATPEALYLFGTLKAAGEDMPTATRSYARATAMGHERARTVLAAIEGGESMEIMQEAKEALVTWSKTSVSSATGRPRYSSSDYDLRDEAFMPADQQLAGPGDHWEHVNVYYTAEKERCDVYPPLRPHYSKSEAVIREECERRLRENNIGAPSPAHEIFGKLEMLRVFGTREHGEKKTDYGYWMDHKLRMPLEVDDAKHRIKFGLSDNPFAVARVGCALLAPDVETDTCVTAIASRVAEEQTAERTSRVGDGGWRKRA